MRLYEGMTLMTNPRRVTIYLAEKGIEIERIHLNMRAGEGKSAAYLAKNPAGTVPLLELDDGGFLSESAAIVEYLEELYPEPNMLGDTPEQRARTRAMERIAVDFITRQSAMLVNTHPFVTRARPGTPQYPSVADAFRGARDQLIATLEVRLGDGAYMAGERVTIADCTLFAGLHVHHTLFDYEIPKTLPRLRKWYARFATRPSAEYSSNINAS